MKLARTIRFDASDLNVFPKAAEEGEWALPGSFVFSAMQADQITGEWKQAFANGFVGCESHGFSTLVSVATAKPGDVAALEASLADWFEQAFGAPTRQDATAAAEQEIDFMADLCASHKIGTLLCIQRDAGEDGITEQFRSLPKPESCAEQKIWTMVADDDSGMDGEADDAGPPADIGQG